MRNPFSVEHIYHERKDFKKRFDLLWAFFYLRGVLHNAHHGDNFVIEYLDKIETEFENSLDFLSGAEMGLIMKKLEVKNFVTHSL